MGDLENRIGIRVISDHEDDISDFHYDITDLQDYIAGLQLQTNDIVTHEERDITRIFQRASEYKIFISNIRAN
jgi:hypothetical protein